MSMCEINEEKLAVQYIYSMSMLSHLVFSCTCNIGSQKVLEERRRLASVPVAS